MSDPFDWEHDDKQIRQLLEWEEEDPMIEEWCKRADMAREMDEMLTEQQEERAMVAYKSSVCPVCGHFSKEQSDYDAADRSVGIFSGVYYNECPEHGIFYTYDDGSQEMEDTSLCLTCGGKGCGDCMDEDAGGER